MVGPSPIKKPPKIAPKEDRGDFSDQLNEELRQGTIHKLHYTRKKIKGFCKLCNTQCSGIILIKTKSSEAETVFSNHNVVKQV